MLLNLTVVYFAFGAPLGVYGIIRNKGTSPHAIASNVFRFLFWPLFAALSVRATLVFRPPQASLEEKLDSLRTEYEAEIGAASVFEFRDVFARYTGLAIASASEENGTIGDELLKIAGRRDRTAAMACLARRDRRRLEFHLLQARNEFTDLISRNATPRIRDLTSRLAELLSELDL